MTMNSNSKPVWVGPIPTASQSIPAQESNAFRVAKLVLIERYNSINGHDPSGIALSEMQTLAKNAAYGLDYVRQEKLLRKFLCKRITKLIDAWDLTEWKRKRKSRGGGTKEASYGVALGWKLDKEMTDRYNSQTGARREEERIESIKLHILEVLPEGKDKRRYEALVWQLDALDFDSVGNVAIGQLTTLRQTAKDLTEICGIETDHKELSRLIPELRRMAKLRYTKSRINKAVIKQSYGVIKVSAEQTAKKELEASRDKPLFTLGTPGYRPPTRSSVSEEGLPIEAPLPHGRIGKAVAGFRGPQTTRGRDVAAAAMALKEELHRLVDAIPSGEPEKKEAALALSIWERFHHHEPQNCKECALRIERIRTLESKWGNNFQPLSPCISTEGPGSGEPKAA